jgi:hypothetical protein
MKFCKDSTAELNAFKHLAFGDAPHRADGKVYDKENRQDN